MCRETPLLPGEFFQQHLRPRQQRLQVLPPAHPGARPLLQLTDADPLSAAAAAAVEGSPPPLLDYLTQELRSLLGILAGSKALGKFG